MRLLKFEHLESYRFNLEFANSEIKAVDLTDLISKRVGLAKGQVKIPASFFEPLPIEGDDDPKIYVLNKKLRKMVVTFS